MATIRANAGQREACFYHTAKESSPIYQKNGQFNEYDSTVGLYKSDHVGFFFFFKKTVYFLLKFVHFTHFNIFSPNNTLNHFIFVTS